MALTRVLLCFAVTVGTEAHTSMASLILFFFEDQRNKRISVIYRILCARGTSWGKLDEQILAKRTPFFLDIQVCSAFVCGNTQAKCVVFRIRRGN